MGLQAGRPIEIGSDSPIYIIPAANYYRKHSP
jgi:hypothetical protein